LLVAHHFASEPSQTFSDFCRWRPNPSTFETILPVFSWCIWPQQSIRPDLSIRLSSLDVTSQEGMGRDVYGQLANMIVVELEYWILKNLSKVRAFLAVPVQRQLRDVPFVLLLRRIRWQTLVSSPCSILTEPTHSLEGRTLRIKGSIRILSVNFVEIVMAE
jgi:hypothetical protein